MAPGYAWGTKTILREQRVSTCLECLVFMDDNINMQKKMNKTHEPKLKTALYSINIVELSNVRDRRDLKKFIHLIQLFILWMRKQIHIKSDPSNISHLVSSY